MAKEKKTLQKESAKKKAAKPNTNKQLSNLSLPGGSRNRFGIIHLSDLQFGKNHTFGHPSTIAEDLLSDIKKMSGEYEFTPLYIVLSGDITDTAHSEEFKDAANVVAEILNGLNIDRANILCIPGNHDVNWNLSKLSHEAGDDQLKFLPYKSLVSKITNSSYTFEKDIYPRITKDTNPRIKDDQTKIDEQLKLKLEFLLLNSCEKIDHENNYPWICKNKLKKSLPAKKEDKSLRIVVSHHSLLVEAANEFREALKNNESDDAIPTQNLKKRLEAIENMNKIRSLIERYKCDIVLTGHIHKCGIKFIEDEENHPIIYSGCGSTGVNQSQREDGVQNQYCIHVLDYDTCKFQSIWRSYNPLYRDGGWTIDNTIKNNTTEYSLPGIQPIADSTAKAAELETKPTAPVMDSINIDKASKIAAAILLGGWNEKD